MKQLNLMYQIILLSQVTLEKLEELFEEQMKQAYFQEHNDRWHVNRSDIPRAFNDYFKTYKL